MTRTMHNTIADLRAQVAALHAELTRNNLVVWTAGNVSARVPGEELLVIKPSGLSYDDIDADAMVVCDLDANLVEGDHQPSSDTAAHAYVYRHMPGSAASCTPTRRTPPPGPPAVRPSRVY